MKKVALVGFASTTIRWDWPDDVDIWSINCAWDYGPGRIDRLLEMHPIEQLTADLDKETKWEGKHWLWLQEPHPFPIYMMEIDSRIPQSIKYPLDEICGDIFTHLWRGDVMNTYLTSSGAYMLALAIHEKYDKIYLAGFEMGTGTEFGYQRDCATYLIRIANGRGINVNLDEHSGMMKAKLYSYEGGQMVYRRQIVEMSENYQYQFETYKREYEKKPEPKMFCTMQRANGAAISLWQLLAKSELPFFGRQGIEHILNMYKSQHQTTMGYMNKFSTSDVFNAMMLAEGAVQAFQNLIRVCDLQEPDMEIRSITNFELINQPVKEPELLV
jgi:hypothetical protein